VFVPAPHRAAAEEPLLTEIDRLAGVADGFLRDIYVRGSLRRIRSEERAIADDELARYFLRPLTDRGFEEEVNLAGPGIREGEHRQFRRLWRLTSEPTTLGDYAVANFHVEETIDDLRVNGETIVHTMAVRRVRLSAVCHRDWPWLRYRRTVLNQALRKRDGRLVPGDTEPAICVHPPDVATTPSN
jgi:hypothetical protein